MYFDTHAHYDDRAFDADREELLAAMPEAGVGLILIPGCDVESSERALAIAEKHPFVYAAVGIHPEELAGCREGDLARIAELAGNERCAAVGEIGLDYYWDASRKEEQKALFAKQLEFALERDLPVIVHDREAHGDCLEIVSRYEGLRGVFHCYSGSAEMAEQLLKQGWYLGFDGPVTYKNARRAPEILALCPLDRMLIETDSPYLSPVPMRGRRNDSRNLCYIAQKIAEIKGVTQEEIAAVTSENGKRLFGIE
ncbi:MAG: TatD family hydrolase [Oscillospiraceae bacterium]|nr:TatD family hydrolase [Oscillospiraceae bacterium]